MRDLQRCHRREEGDKAFPLPIPSLPAMDTEKKGAQDIAVEGKAFSGLDKSQCSESSLKHPSIRLPGAEPASQS